MKFKLFTLLLVFLLAALAVTPAFAQACDPASDPACVVEEVPSPAEPTNPSLPDVAVLVAIVAFFKKRLSLQENGVITAVLVVGAVLWFTPLISEKFPDVGVWLDQGMAFVKWVLASMGAVDFLINTGVKIATGTAASVK